MRIQIIHPTARQALLSCCITLLFILSGCQAPETRYPVPPVSGADVRINVADLQNEQVRFYSYPTGGKQVNFFVLRISDQVSSFLDACVTCYRKKQGYAQEDALVVCRACGKRYSVHQLEQGLGGCFPIKLEGRLQGKEYFIPVSAIERSAPRF